MLYRVHLARISVDFEHRDVIGAAVGDVEEAATGAEHQICRMRLPAVPGWLSRCGADQPQFTAVWDTLKDSNASAELQRDKSPQAVSREDQVTRAAACRQMQPATLP